MVTWNIWGVKWITPSIDARMAAIAPALLALEPDVVLLQEVWRQEDGWLIGAALQEGGLDHIRYFQGPERSSGLMVASRYPITAEGFTRFTLGGFGYIPFHLDWMCDKGLARVEVATPVGPVVIGATHLNGGYHLDSYPVVRATQALEAAAGLGEEAAPLVVGGDLNSPAADFPFEVFASRAGVTPTAENFDLDSIFTRSGERVRVEVTASTRLLEDPQATAADGDMVLSDHPAILADLLLVPAPPGSASQTPDPGWPALRRRALDLVRESQDSTRSQMQLAGAGAILMLVALLWVLIRSRRWTRVWGALLCASLMVWLAHFAVIYAPDQLGGLTTTAAALTDAAGTTLGQP